MKNMIRMLLAILSTTGLSLAGSPLVIHEWGTFTVLQDETGASIPGINTDDEPVPDFVHRAWLIQNAPPSESLLRSKGVQSNHADVWMRLETPVVYFYPPAGEEVTLDFKVEFPGGWLTEYYPDAVAFPTDLMNRQIKPGDIGTLEWKGLRVGGKAPGPQTDAKVWTAPRIDDAASVTTAKGETERYLFYRGVAKVESPIRVTRNNDSLSVRYLDAKEETPSRVWLADFRGNGMTAFRELTMAGNQEMPANFADSDYSLQNLDELRAKLKAELIRDGLFLPEADAMLNTWEESYFRNRGTRLFYLVPKAWTDRHLPLKISVGADVTRVMIGRIELMTPEKRRLIKTLAERKSFTPGDPPAAYFLLSRFANAILLDEMRQRPSENLRQFLNGNRLALVGLTATVPGAPR